MIGKDPRPSEIEMDRTRELAGILIPVLREIARSCGYALLAHGSQQRDIDLVACPWREGDSLPPPEYLAKRFFSVCDAVLGGVKWAGGWREGDKQAPPSGSLPNPERKPHGRLAWVIHLHVTYIDLSVFPPVSKPAVTSKRKRDAR